MFTEPKVDQRADQHYAGIRSQVPMSALPTVIPQYVGEVITWLAARGAQPNGPPLVRYHTCPPTGHPDAILDITVGWPVASAPAGDGQIVAGVIPAGRYAALVFTGVENGYAGNGALVEWAAREGIEWDHWEDPLGDAFAGRVEWMLDGPDDDPSPSNWRTEVAIKIADR